MQAITHQPTTRTTDETLQVSASCAALPLHPQPDPQPFPTPSSSPQCQPVPHGSQYRLLHVARCCRNCVCSLTPALLGLPSRVHHWQPDNAVSKNSTTISE